MRGGGKGLTRRSALVLCASGAVARAASSLTIGLASSSLTAGTARIAKEIGIFEKHGLDARLIIMDSGNPLVSRSIDLAVSGTGDFITARARGQDLVAIADVYSGLGAGLVIAKTVADRLAVPANAPVSDRLKVLDGLVIGTTSPTSVTTITLRAAAAAVGANVRFTYLAQPTFTAALESGAIQGHIGGAPFWARSVIRGSGVLWINGSKGEFPPEYAPVISAVLGARRDTATAKPQLMKQLAAVFVDLGRVVEERPAEVKAAISRLFPDLEATTIDLLFDSESGAWKAPPITVERMVHEIAYMKSSGQVPPGIDSLDPASLVYP